MVNIITSQDQAVYNRRITLYRMVKILFKICISLFWRFILISLIITSVGTIYNEKMTYIKHTLPVWTKIITIPSEVILILCILISFFINAKEKLRSTLQAPLDAAEQIAVNQWINEDMQAYAAAAAEAAAQRSRPQRTVNPTVNTILSLVFKILVIILFSLSMMYVQSENQKEIENMENVVNTYPQCELIPTNVTSEWVDSKDDDGESTEILLYHFDYSYTYNGVEYTGSSASSTVSVIEKRPITIYVNPEDTESWVFADSVETAIEMYDFHKKYMFAVGAAIAGFLLFSCISSVIQLVRRRP